MMWSTTNSQEKTVSRIESFSGKIFEHTASLEQNPRRGKDETMSALNVATSRSCDQQHAPQWHGCIAPTAGKSEVCNAAVASASATCFQPAPKFCAAGSTTTTAVSAMTGCQLITQAPADAGNNKRLSLVVAGTPTHLIPVSAALTICIFVFQDGSFTLCVPTIATVV